MTQSVHAELSKVGVTRARLGDQVSDAIRRLILMGEYLPGQRLVETELARALSVSQAPVREALRQLAHEGIVVQLARRGTFVATVDADEARKAYEVRAVLERIAATEFCAVGSDEVIDELSSVVQEIRTAAGANDLPSFVEADMRFHRTIWDACEHPLLPKFWPLIEATVRSFTTVSNQLYFGDLIEIAEAHLPLLDALRARNGALASDLFHDHTIEVWRRIEHSEAPDG
jgi:DNA-binding GntR family transcriptional regulator